MRAEAQVARLIRLDDFRAVGGKAPDSWFGAPEGVDTEDTVPAPLDPAPASATAPLEYDEQEEASERALRRPLSRMALGRVAAVGVGCFAAAAGLAVAWRLPAVPPRAPEAQMEPEDPVVEPEVAMGQPLPMVTVPAPVSAEQRGTVAPPVPPKAEEVRQPPRPAPAARANPSPSPAKPGKRFSLAMPKPAIARAEVAKKLLDSAWTSMEIGSYQAALRAYAEAVRLDPTSTDAHFGVALALFELGQDRDAARWLGKTLVRDPRHGPANVLAAFEAQNRRDLPAARKFYGRYMKLYPNGLMADEVWSVLQNL